MTIETDAATLEPGRLVELFDLDLTDFDGGTHRFYDGERPEAAQGKILWRGNEYFPRPIRAEGFEITADGRPPRPTLSISNVGNLIGVLVASYADIVGARFLRWRTFERYLDGQPQADPDQHFPTDVYVINRKTAHTNEAIAFELSTPLDQTSKMLPGRIVQKRYCPWRYRIYDADFRIFDYTDVECPYTGTRYYTAAGELTAEAGEDRCGKRLSDCKLRFPRDSGEALPYGGFPGIRRFG